MHKQLENQVVVHSNEHLSSTVVENTHMIQYKPLFIQTNATAVKKSIVVGLKSEKSNEVEHVLLEDLMAAL